MTAIVYIATNRINGKRYIGVTRHGLDFRRRQHEHAVNAKRVTCRYFHAAIRKHGKEAFDWIELLHCETFEEALQQEIRLISEIRPEYNLTPGGQGNAAKRGPLKPEALASRRAKLAGYSHSPEARAKISAALRQRERSPETGRKISDARKGIKFSAQQIEKIRRTSTGRKQTAETIARRVAHRVGKPLSDEHKQRIAKALAGRKRPPEVIVKMREGLRRFRERGAAQ